MSKLEPVLEDILDAEIASRLASLPGLIDGAIKNQEV
jgi:hypothetical protein